MYGWTLYLLKSPKVCFKQLELIYNFLTQVYKTQKLVNAGISDITIRPDKKILATAGWDHRIRIFGWKKLKPLAVLDYHTATVHCVSFSDHRNPCERLLAAGSKDHRISIWSIYTQTWCVLHWHDLGKQDWWSNSLHYNSNVDVGKWQNVFLGWSERPRLIFMLLVQAASFVFQRGKWISKIHNKQSQASHKQTQNKSLSTGFATAFLWQGA